MSEVSVDEALLAAQADAIADEHAPAAPVPDASAPGEIAPPGAPNPEQVLQGYQVLTSAIADRAAAAIAPAWNITPDEKKAFSDACAQALVLWFPDQLIPPKYMALLVIAGVGLEIVEKRRDPITGELKPRHHAQPKQPARATEQRAPRVGETITAINPTPP